MLHKHKEKKKKKNFQINDGIELFNLENSWKFDIVLLPANMTWEIARENNKLVKIMIASIV